ncbi:MAG TPA: hypothetical protein VLF60_01175 [Candidatus Saccharimonadales bacterium]|nr:hypothetical protein [Candidatus Saccharimonadales bacterium]
MAGTKAGGEKAAKMNKTKYGTDFYARIGAKGGKATGPKGFAVNRELARAAGAKGGRISRRGKATVVQIAPIQVQADDDQTQFDLAA